MVYRIGICDCDSKTCEAIERFVFGFFEMREDKAETFVWYTGDGCCKGLLNGTEIDILFLNVHLPMKSGMEVGRYIRSGLKNNTMHIIYISEKANCAPELFQIHPYDFLVKPVMQEHISRVMNDLFLAEMQDRRCFAYINRKSIHKIPYEKIQYFASRNRHIEVYLEDGTIREFNGRLKEILSGLPVQFILVSQSYIINLKYVKACRYDHVVMMNNDNINISRPNRLIFREKINAYNKKK